MESNPPGSRTDGGTTKLLNHSLHFLLAFGNIPERRSGLGVNKRQMFVPWLILSSVFSLIHVGCVAFLPPLHPCSSGNLSKTCTADGWTPITINYAVECGYDSNDSLVDADEVSMDGEAGPPAALCFRPSPSVFVQQGYYTAIKVGYTIGHSVSLLSLTIGIIILCLFR